MSEDVGLAIRPPTQPTALKEKLDAQLTESDELGVLIRARLEGVVLGG
jgi:hypothetical protein